MNKSEYQKIYKPRIASGSTFRMYTIHIWHLPFDHSLGIA